MLHLADGIRALRSPSTDHFITVSVICDTINRMRRLIQQPFRRLSVFLFALVLCACSGSGNDGFSIPGWNSNTVRRESADWVAALGEAYDARQLFIVAGVGQTTAYVTMHEIDERGNWVELMTTPGFIRMASADAGEDSGTEAAVSVYSLNASKGISEDPGCVLQYRTVIANDYLAAAGVAIPEVCMRTVMREVRRDCVAVIDDLKELSSETYNSLFGTIGPFFANNYTRSRVVEAGGRQGVCCDDKYYYVSGSASLVKYDRDWEVVAANNTPFQDLEGPVNHIGDIDVYRGELYCVIESFRNGTGENMQIVVYDAGTLEYKRALPVAEESGQSECSGIAVNPDTKTLWLCSWSDGESGRYLYRYDLTGGKYLGKTEMISPPQWIQGIAYHDGSFYLTADDGDAENNEPDSLYRTTIEYGKDSCVVVPEKVFDDVTRQGEIEGLSFDHKNRQLLLLYNRGLRIVRGRSNGYYDGYKREISEIFLYDIE